MKIVNPLNTNHYIKLIPRFIPTDEIILELTNEANKAKEIVEVTYLYDNGYIAIEFYFEFKSKDIFSFKLTNDNGVIFRGKILATSQQTQNYKQTEGVYIYEF